MKYQTLVLLFVLSLISFIACQPATTAVTATLTSATPIATKDPSSIPVIIYTDDSNPPYTFQENGEAKGIYVEILKTAFSRLDGYTVSIEPLPWKRGLEHIENGTGFALFPPYYRPDDRPWMEYSVPIFEEELVIFCNADVLQTPRPHWPQDYAGLRIGKNLGFASFTEEQQKTLDEYHIVTEETVGNEANLLKVAMRRTDCYINDRLTVLSELQRLKANGSYDPGGTQAEIREGVVMSSEQGYVGYTTLNEKAYPFKADFMAQLDAILTTMKESGEIERIVTAYINQP